MRSPRKGLEVIAGCEDLKADPLSHTLKFSSHSSTARSLCRRFSAGDKATRHEVFDFGCAIHSSDLPISE